MSTHHDTALAELRGLEVVKGHGTGNDFVLVPDASNVHPLTAHQVRALADRHTGIGADGVLRVVPTATQPEVADQADQARWFMDYRNGDGSVAEMCGNGARVFARYRQLLLRRAASPAFHPFGKQEIFDLGSSVFAVRRSSPAGDQHVLCLQNVTAQIQTVSGYILQPYQTLWLNVA